MEQEQETVSTTDGYFLEEPEGTVAQKNRAERTATSIQAPCGCFARPGEALPFEEIVCLHGQILQHWPVGVWPDSGTV